MHNQQFGKIKLWLQKMQTDAQIKVEIMAFYFVSIYENIGTFHKVLRQRHYGKLKPRAPPHSDLILAVSDWRLLKVAYNKAKEEKKWREWKEKEEQLLRKYGMSESEIKELRKQDWEEFKSERRFREHQIPVSDFFDRSTINDRGKELVGIEQLLDSVQDERLLQVLVEADQRTLQIVLYKAMGFSVGEISQKIGISKKAIYCRIDRLKKKIGKIL